MISGSSFDGTRYLQANRTWHFLVKLSASTSSVICSFGYASEEAIGQPTTLIPEDRLHEEDSIIANVREGRTLEHYETVSRHKKGTVLDISLTVSLIRDSTTATIGPRESPKRFPSTKEPQIVRRCCCWR
jgi:hypothetical protein